MKKILITGCSTGFGFDAAKYLAEKGHYVYASMRNTTTKNAIVATELRNFAESRKVNIEVVDIDVTSNESVDAAAASLPAIDVLINNAGIGFGGPMEAFSSEEIKDQLDLNIVGTVRVAKAVLPGMRVQKSGLIIQVSSTAGRAAFPGWGLYHASKWGLEGMSEAMRYELAPLGIDVVLVERIMDSIKANTVSSDHYKGACLVVEHLLQSGHKNIAILCGDTAVKPYYIQCSRL